MDRPKANCVGRKNAWYEFKCADCGAIYIRSANTSKINPYCGKCNQIYLRERQKAQSIARQQAHDKEKIQMFAHELKETFNQEFPSNYPSTKPYFTLENVRKLVDEVAKEMFKE